MTWSTKAHWLSTLYVMHFQLSHLKAEMMCNHSSPVGLGIAAYSKRHGLVPTSSSTSFCPTCRAWALYENLIIHLLVCILQRKPFYDNNIDIVMLTSLSWLLSCPLQNWYVGQMKMISDWLSDRLDLSLHPYQLTCLMTINRVSAFCQCCVNSYFSLSVCVHELSLLFYFLLFHILISFRFLSESLSSFDFFLNSKCFKGYYFGVFLTDLQCCLRWNLSPFFPFLCKSIPMVMIWFFSLCTFFKISHNEFDV